MGQRLLVGTLKGLFEVELGGAGGARLLEPQHFGAIVNHAVLDPRDGKTALAAVSTGHLGPTVFRSSDGGRSWQEAEKPPAFAQGEGRAPRSVKRVFWLTPGHASEPGVWFAGTTPHGLFKSLDGGVSWEPVAGFNDHPSRPEWSGDEAFGTPDGPITHSILVDPRDPKRMLLGLSGGGVFVSDDGGADWKPMNEGVAADFMPDPNVPFGHDPHCVQIHPKMPDRIYQQNHCGIYRLDRPATRWQRIGDNMPRAVGDVGFPIVLHPEDPDRVWVLPMDGTSVWPRTSVEGRPAVFRTCDAGASWERQDRGFPERAWWTVKRQGFCAFQGPKLGLAFGTSSGEVWVSDNEGESWTCAASHLPHIISVTSFGES